MTRRTLTASVSPVANSKATTVTVYRNEMNQMIDRLACPPGNGQREPPVNRVNTSQRLEMLRKAMTLSKVDSYIITGDDEHQVFHSTVIGFFFSNDSAFDDWFDTIFCGFVFSISKKWFHRTTTGGNLSPVLRAVLGQLSWQTNEPFYGRTAATIYRPICNWIASGLSWNPDPTRFFFEI